MMVPKLRFTGFNDPWSETSLGKISSFITSGSRDWAQYYSDCGDKFIRMTNLVRDGITLNLSDLKFVRLPENSNEGKRTALQHHDILISITAELGKLGWVPDDLGTAYINQHTALVRPDLSIVSSKFIANLLSTKKYNNILNQQNDAGAKSGLNLSTIKNFGFYVPNKIEQTKIADFLTAVDEKITLLNKQYNLLSLYKKGMMQKIFSQEVRFKDENGEEFPEWNSCQLRDVSTRVTRKNIENNQTILTISGRDGLVEQMSYFNKQIASKNVSGYYLIKNGEFAYNKSYSQGYPMGAIKMLTNYDKGVVSTLYICFKLNTDQSNSFYQHYFESGLQNRSIEKVAQEGARNHGLLNIGVNDFFDIELQIPSLKEQIKISDYLSALDDKIAAKKTELDKLKAWKLGLLQQMFI
ncbi:restriction endonuclease subunit S [Cronobacter sakazakii]|nr:restriction endonuclease subunit S [Cronobacter sakazakii]ELY2539366.1 restriction endonuclease subunit S [Cronobacter sakazakii]ELY4822156.1 restriction endonuclease subunit S [Cronobacter sakazakii]ELY4838544.1 restriction endonuclease subunit S [Cronobacter sakazakii]ELY5864139.1 restriction endonuclease subunit S [Cronobacter sakazakii]